MLDWTSTFSLPSEHLLKRNTLLTTLPYLAKEWRISFEFKPNNYNYKGYAQIIHMTISGKGGPKGKVGERTPALWIHKTSGVLIATTLNGKPSSTKLLRTKKPLINVWNIVDIRQVKEGNKYMFSFVINGESLWSVENTKPEEFSDVKVFASSNWYEAQAGSIRQFQIENRAPGEMIQPKKRSYIELQFWRSSGVIGARGAHAQETEPGQTPLVQLGNPRTPAHWT